MLFFMSRKIRLFYDVEILFWSKRAIYKDKVLTVGPLIEILGIKHNEVCLKRNIYIFHTVYNAKGQLSLKTGIISVKNFTPDRLFLVYSWINSTN